MPSTVTIAPVILKQQLRQDGTYPVKIRVTFKRESKRLSTNFTVEKHQLTRSMEIRDQDVADAIDAVIRDMRRAVNTLSPFRLESMNVNEVVAYIEDYLVNEAHQFSLDFPAYCAEKVAGKPKAARMNYMCAVRSLGAFLGTEHYDISVISSSMMKRYENYLRKKYGDTARAVSLYTSSIAAVHRWARQEYNNEESDELLIKNPFEYYKCPKRVFGVHRDIDMAVVRKMQEMRTSLSGLERLGVDFFLISFGLMGMNAPDIYKCRKPKEGIIVYNRTKTESVRPDKAEMHVRLEPWMDRLLAEYRDYGGEYLFMFHNRYAHYNYLGKAANTGLKRFRERIGYDKKIDVYSARHTWGTFARSLRIDRSTVDECLCHADTSMRMADIYIRRDWSILWDANAEVLSQIGWPD